MKVNRKVILERINEIEGQHCQGCQLRHQKGNKQKACVKFCEIGKEIARIGKPLTVNVRTNVEEIEQEVKLGTRGYKTKMIMYLYDKGHTSTEIIALTGFNPGTVSSTIIKKKAKRLAKGGA